MKTIFTFSVFCISLLFCLSTRGEEREELSSIGYINTAAIRAPFMMGANKFNQSFIDFAKQYHIDILLSGVAYADSKNQMSDEFTKFINDKKIDNDELNLKLGKNNNASLPSFKVSYINTPKIYESVHLEGLSKEEQTKLVKELNDKLRIFAEKYEIDLIIVNGYSTKVIYISPEVDLTGAFIKSIDGQDVVVENRKGYGLTNQLIKYIDADKLLRYAPMSIEASERLRIKYKDRESELVSLSKQVEEGKLGISVFKTQKDEFNKDLSKDKKYEFQRVLEYQNKKIKEIALKNNINFIFQDCVFINPKFDLTMELLSNQ